MMGTLGLLLLLLPLAAPLIAQDSMQAKDSILETSVCDFYNESCDNGCPSERCNLSSQSSKTQCFVTWTNSTDKGPEVLLKGCFYYDTSCQERKCISYEQDGHIKNGQHTFFCCCHGNYCNSHFLWDPRDEATTPPKPINTNLGTLSAVLITLGVLFVMFVFISIAFYCYRRQKLANFVELPTIESTAITQAHSTPNIITRPIKILEMKAYGRFAGVWKAEWDSNIIAVKIFPIQDQQSWTVEKQLYSLPQMNHENVLHFIGVERRGEGLNSELWLLTAFHEFGSLYDYLKGHVITWSDLCQIGESMAQGLAYLHSEQTATKLEGLKPPIAHRDFKSKNVLLKSNMTACIADFGLAMTFYPGQLQGESFGQVGTRRYMAPEVLEGAIMFNREAFLPIDMYACSLILWELVSRCSSQDGPVGEYQLPFEDLVGLHPTLDDMQECVVTHRKRPTIQESWNNHKGLRAVVHMMQECWDPEADARLSASCIVERFASLSRQPQLAQTSLSIKEASF